jgi:hypothetical protein
MFTFLGCCLVAFVVNMVLGVFITKFLYKRDYLDSYDINLCIVIWPVYLSGFWLDKLHSFIEGE